jgi:hypothetical protein
MSDEPAPETGAGYFVCLSYARRREETTPCANGAPLRQRNGYCTWKLKVFDCDPPGLLTLKL